MVPLLWNAFGVGIVFPIYCLVHIQHAPRHEDRISLRQARALPITALLATILPPAIALLPPHVDRTPQAHQTMIVLFVVAPVAAHVLQWLSAESISNFLGRADAKPSNSTLVRLTYVITGVVSALPHLYVLVRSLVTPNTETGFTRVFIPTHSLVQPGSSSVILEGAHLFLQYDNLFFELTCMLWNVALLRPWMREMTTLKQGQVFVSMILATFFLGSGATVSAVFWLREGQAKGKETPWKDGEKSRPQI